MGDGRGIGPEVILRALSMRSIRNLADYLIIGSLKTLRRHKRFGHVISGKSGIGVLDVGSGNADTVPVVYLDTALRLLKQKRADALVTGPVNKEVITKAGIKFIGHTEYLRDHTSSKNVAMMFVGKRLKVTVVTRHITLKSVSKRLTKEKIIDAVKLTHSFLKNNFKIRNPRIGVCALNPHAGENGVIGREEIDIIRPAINGLKRTITDIDGPLPADSAFNSLYRGKFDSLIAMYHDQAMIPVKMVGRESCVNVTLGLPFVRTSPVHGTAYDIAGRGIADPSGMIESIRLAAKLCLRRPR